MVLNEGQLKFIRETNDKYQALKETEDEINNLTVIKENIRLASIGDLVEINGGLIDDMREIAAELKRLIAEEELA
jgi:hypothetical protein